MSKYVGKTFLLKASDNASPENYTIVAAQLTTSFETSGGPIDVTDKDDGPWRKLMEGGVLSADISSRGLITREEGHALLMARAGSGSIDSYEVHFQDGMVLSRRFQIVEFSGNGDYDGAQQYELKLSSASDTSIAEEVLPVVVPGANHYDGTTQYGNLGSAPAVADGKKLTVSLWFNREAAGGTFVAWRKSTFHPVLYSINTTGHHAVSLRTAANGVIIARNNTSPDASVGQWYHSVFSIDTAASPSFRWYIDGVSQGTAGGGSLDIGLAVDDIIIGAHASAFTNKYAGCLKHIFVHNDVIDLSVASNLLKFRAADGTPADMGADASSVFGVQPLIYMPGGDPSDNRGSLGDFILTGGPLAACGSNP